MMNKEFVKKMSEENLKQYSNHVLIAVIKHRMDELLLEDVGDEMLMVEASLPDKYQISSQTLLAEPALHKDSVHPRHAQQPTFDIVCAMCGEDSSVPFRPNPKWPTYCRVCYDKRRGV